MKYTKKIGNSFFTIEENDDLGFRINSFSKLFKTFFTMWIGTIVGLFIVLGILKLIGYLLSLFIS